MSNAERTELIRRVLGKDYIELQVEHLSVEHGVGGDCRVKVSLPNGAVLEDRGVGQIDAIFSALKAHHIKEFSSLRSVELADFSVRLDRRTRYRQGGDDAKCLVSLSVENSRGTKYEFLHTSCSLAISATRAIADAVEFFINSEKAFCIVRAALKDAEQRNRDDLVIKYLKEISILAEHASYTTVIPK